MQSNRGPGGRPESQRLGPAAADAAAATDAGPTPSAAAARRGRYWADGTGNWKFRWDTSRDAPADAGTVCTHGQRTVRPAAGRPSPAGPSAGPGHAAAAATSSHADGGAARLIQHAAYSRSSGNGQHEQRSIFHATPDAATDAADAGPAAAAADAGPATTTATTTTTAAAATAVNTAAVAAAAVVAEGGGTKAN